MCWLGTTDTKYNVNHFTLHIDTYTTGFQVHSTINLLKPIEEQLQRRRLNIGPHVVQYGYEENLKKTIEHNASLRIDFGWAFESMSHFTAIMNECIEKVIPKYNVNVGRMVSDMRCSWLGFEPHNMYDKDVYKHFRPIELVIYNNEIIDFQTEIVKTVSTHPIYIQHALIRDTWYRFETFKAIRKDRVLLEEKYHSYMKSIREISGVTSIPRDILEDEIGTHFLYHPDLFFELLEFSILKGDVYE